MADYQWNFASVFQSWPLLLQGLQGTLVLAVACIAAAAVIGLVVGAAKYAATPWLRWPASVFVEVFRNIPVLVQVMWMFFALPALVGVKLSVFVAAFLAISLNAGAFSAEIFRAGIQSIARGQWDASRALGMTYGRMMVRVILPQAIKRMVPAFTNRAVEIVKTTAIASVISYLELLHAGRTVASSNFNPIETFTIVGAIFIGVVYPLSLAARALELRLQKSE
jgi:polar amino acid transport system permease protein